MTPTELWDQVKLRYPHARLVKLVNALIDEKKEDITDAAIVTMATQVASDVIVDLFPREVQQVWDPVTYPGQVPLAVGGWIAVAQDRGGTSKQATVPTMTQWKTWVETYRNTGPRARAPTERGGKEYDATGREIPKWSPRSNYHWMMPRPFRGRPANSDAGWTYGG